MTMRVLLTALALSLCGCVVISDDKMPGDWPALASYLNPAEMNGTYLAGDNALGALFFEKRYQLVAKADEYQLTCIDQQKLKIEAISGGRVVATAIEPYGVSQGKVVINGSHGTNREGILAYEEKLLLLCPSAAGDLIIQYKGTFAGMAMLVPLAGKEVHWHMAHRMKPAA